MWEGEFGESFFTEGFVEEKRSSPCLEVVL